MLGRLRFSGEGSFLNRLGAYFLAVVVLVSANMPSAFAHARTYVWNQEYKTLPQGQFELESHTTVKAPRMGKHSSANSWKYEEELEYGILDRWTVAHYQQWETQNQEGLDDSGVANKDVTKYSGFKFETKYRIGDKGKYWVDPLLYFEYAYDPRDRFSGAPHVLEGKVVLSKDIKKFNVTYNQIMESGLGHKGRTEHEFTFGANYELLEGFRPGFEMKGQLWNPGSNKNELGLGPTLAYEGKYFWVAGGVLLAANHHADDFQAKVSVGVPFG